MKAKKFMTSSLGKMGTSQTYWAEYESHADFQKQHAMMLYVAEKLSVVSSILLLPSFVLVMILTANTLFFFLTQWPRSSTDKGFEKA